MENPSAWSSDAPRVNASGAPTEPDAPWDVLVVGGGATGLGVAVQAALQGQRVTLLEAGDWACGTSSRSTKLLHGGVRYLAQGQWRLVRESLRERATVLALAPHLAQPLSFVVPGASWLSWAWTGMGLKVYQWLSGRWSLGRTVALSRRQLLARCPGDASNGVAGGTAAVAGSAGPQNTWVAGMRYWDAQFEDARLALALAKTARRAGASLHNHARVTGLQRESQGWRVQWLDERSGQTRVSLARCVVNATGVWVDGLRHMALSPSSSTRSEGTPVKPLVTASQGVHLVVARERLPIREAVLIPRTADGRVLFAVPWLGATVIGTTDTPCADAPQEPVPMAEELEFLFREARQSLGVSLSRADVLSVWVGLRPLVVQGAAAAAGGSTSQMSREHLIRREAPGFVTVTGGKWTTYRSMAEQVMQALAEHGDLAAGLGVAPSPVNTALHRLVGAPPVDSATTSVSAAYSRIGDAPGLHLWGTEAEEVLRLPGAGLDLGMGLSEAMVRFAARHEWALTVEDMLARRWRALFLDARQAARMAPAVAALLKEETGLDPRLEAFLELCHRYTLAD
ncbi:glycerol-3-phosphate dehydrogenase/oxidase [Limnohabitans sp. Bal53]|uniref:glycerol-3-phosphate dehydrogenase/oxidase n=1 Tax=Limnohabitans sp. Bal53 TaxID=1977910 RepID=UPI001E5562C6|nr:glycerol-3-phosphate dehydrogenase/oxidase [Limnohabitans sp. Bal53]